MTTAAADAEVQEAFERALAQDAQVTAPELPPPPRRNVASDPDAPHGVDGDGTPLAPFGVNKKTGRPNLRPPGPGRPGKDKSGEPRTREATPADAVPAKGNGGKPKGGLEPADYAGPLMEASEAIWFGGSMVAKVGPQVPVLGKLLPGRKLAATMAVFDSERPRLVMALNLAAQHDQRARNLAVKLAAGEVGWALTCMFMVAPFTGAVAAVWQTTDEHDVLAERELPGLDELAGKNEAALDAMLARIAGQMQAAQLAMAQAQANDAAGQSVDGQAAA
jgi:hypothetical protein